MATIKNPEKTATVPSQNIDATKPPSGLSISLGKSQASRYARGRIGAKGIFGEINTIATKHRQQTAPKIASDIKQKLIEALPSLGVKVKDQTQLETVAEQIAQNTTNQTFEALGKIQDPQQINQVIADNLTEQIYSNPEISPSLKDDQIKTYEKLLDQTVDITQNNQASLEQAAALGNLQQVSTLNVTDSDTQSIIQNQIEQVINSEAPLTTPNEKSQITETISTYISSYQAAIQQRLPSLSAQNIPSLSKLQEIKGGAHNHAVAQTATKFAQNTNGNLPKIGFQNLATNIAGALGLTSLTPTQIETYGLGYAQPKTLTFAQGSLVSRTFSVGLSLARPKAQQEAYLSLLAYDQDRLSSEIQKLTDRKGNLDKSAKSKRNVLISAQDFVNKKPKKFQTYLSHFSKSNLRGASNIAWNTTQASFNQFGFYAPRSTLGNQKLTQRLSSRTFDALAFQSNIFKFEISLGAIYNYLNFNQIFYSPPDTLSQSPQLNIPKFNNLIQTIRTARGMGGTLQTAKTAKTAFQAGSTVIKGISGPAGWAMLAAQLLSNRTVKRLFAGALALAAYLLLMSLLKFAGLLAGLGFGAITGLPLLAIPVAGPILYVGWTAFWGAYGFANPFGMFNVVSNTLALPGKIWHAITEGFSSSKEGISSFASGAPPFTIGSTLFNLLANAINGLLNGLGAIGSALLSGFSAFGSFLLSGLGGISLSIAAIPFFGVLGIIAAITIFITVINNTTTPGQASGIISKTSTPATISNNQSFDYQIKYKDSCLATARITDTLPASVSLDSIPQVTILNNEAVESVNLIEPAQDQLTPNFSGKIVWEVKLKNNYVSGCNPQTPTDIPPNQDTCAGKISSPYNLTNPFGNFGDPQCNFSKSGLYQLLQKYDPLNAYYWFNTVIICESSYNPNNFLFASSSGLGAYGLYQMNPKGQGNSQYDAGNVVWTLQTTNAINYNNDLIARGIGWQYWQCAKGTKW